MSERPRIYDTFPFDGELDLLEHRLRECHDLVDAFILVEAAVTHQGAPKAMVFEAARERFAWAAAKIRRIGLQALGVPAVSTRARESLQRDALMLGLRDARPTDVVLLMDADEIPSRTLLETLRAEGLDRPRRLALTRHYEAIDRLGPRSPCCPDRADAFPFAVDRIRPPSWSDVGPPWLGSSAVAVRYRDLTGDPLVALPPRSPTQFRRNLQHAPLIEGAGRHLHAVDKAARLESKLRKGLHEEFADGRSASPIHLRRAHRYAVHHRGWWYAESPGGALPDDLARLCRLSPHLHSGRKPPPMLLRRLFRTWSWLRLDPRWADPWVRTIDRHFEALLLPLALPLLLLDGLRAMAAKFKWRWVWKVEPHPSHGPH